MKLTFVIILLACLHASATGYSQSRISVTFRQTNLKMALSLIEQKSDYRFLYQDALLRGTPVITDEFRDAEVTSILDKILEKTGLTYEVLPNKLVALKTKPVAIQEKAQVQISGTVKSSTGEPIIGASVRVKGFNAGTSTNEVGAFSITAPDTAVLVVSSVGFQTLEVPVQGRTVINVVLQAAESELDQVVVIGYGTANKRDLTGSIAQVKGDEVADKPAANPLASLQGKVAGLTVVNAGQAGSEPDIRIRGTNSINGLRPVYIVDGILNDNINFLNPADIESIEVLKDPSSLAIFGVRGANGAIAITTKKARVGQLMVNFNTSVGIKQVINKMDMTNAAQFKELYNEQLDNQGSAAFDYTNWTGNTDWQNEIFQKGILNYNNISITGATDKSRFYMGVGFMTEEGIIKHEKYQKITFNLSDELKVNDHIKFGFTFNGYRAELPDNKGVASAIRAAPIAPVMDETTGLYHILPNFQSAQVYNPLIDVELQKQTTIPREYRAVGSIYGEINFLQHFTFKTSFYADYGFNTSRSYQPIVLVYNPDIQDDYKVDSLVRQTSVDQSQNIYPKLQSDYLLTYKNSFGEHDLTVMGGVTTYFSSYEATSSRVLQGSSFPIPNNPDKWYTDQVGDVTTKTGSGAAWEQSTLSYLGRALYSYAGKYLLNASFRRDGSSAFPYNKWQNFGAVGVGWVISREDFFRDQNVLDYLKLRGSWGVLGNQNIGGTWRYPAFPTLSAGSSAVFGDGVIAALKPDYLVDSLLHWETVHAFEIGMELATFHNKLHAEFNYYDKLTKDIIVTVPAISGATDGLRNLGELTNRGVEIVLSWDDQIGRDWTYSVSGNLTTIDNKVNKLSTPGYQITNPPSRTTAGYPIGYFYGYDVIGVYQTDAEILRSPSSSIGTVAPGDLKYRDVNGDGAITEADRTMIGNPTPDLTYGASLNVGYKGFNLGIDVTGVYGNEIFRNWNRSTFAQFNYQAHSLDRWNGPGTTNTEPILNTGRSNNYQVSSYWIEDGSFFRIRNVQLGYNFNQQMLERLHLKSLRIYANAQNLATFTNSTGYTPEIGGSATAFGVDNGTYPVPAIYTLGLNLNF